jgi:hypothetical protein
MAFVMQRGRSAYVAGIFTHLLNHESTIGLPGPDHIFASGIHSNSAYLSLGNSTGNAAAMKNDFEDTNVIVIQELGCEMTQIQVTRVSQIEPRNVDQKYPP